MNTIKEGLGDGNVIWTLTGYPLHGSLVTPHDTNDLAVPGYVRANEAGDVTAIPFHGAAAITLALAAGEFFPCLVSRVLDTGTDPITIHVFY